MTYNVFHLYEPRDSTDTIPNRMLDYVIETDPDIVCFQEAIT